MSKILIYFESVQGKLKNSSLELLSATSGHEVYGVVIGENTTSIASELSAYPLKKIFSFSSPDFRNYNSPDYIHVFSSLIKEVAPDIVLASGSTSSRDFMPRLAARFDSGIINDGIEIKIDDSHVRVKRSLYSGKCFAMAEFSDASKIKFVLMRPNQLPLPNKSGSGAEVVAPVFSKPSSRVVTKDIIKNNSSKADLTEASVVVAGGRGMGVAENFKLLDSLAETLGASVGASRAVVDAGWVPHSYQVGQTGKTVAPNLYIACGISGAIQHLAGMSSSKVIVAINKDPEAPIFKKATYGIVGDALEIIPKLQEELSKVLQR